MAARLIGEAGVAPKRLRIVDPGDRLLERWRICAATVGMSRLRSPSVHHLDLNPRSLSYFATRRRRRESKPFAGAYDRPSLALFNAHSDHVLKTFGLPDLHIQDRATAGSVDCDGVEIALSGGRKIEARNVVLAVGGGEQPEWPDWVSRNLRGVHHVFDPGFDGWPSKTETVAVIGGGISAAQTALRLKSEGHRVHMVSRHALREHRFDSAPGWLGPKYMVGFNHEKDLARRRAIITEARHRGSVPPGVRLALCGAAARNQIYWHVGDVEALDRQSDDLVLRLKTDEVLHVDRVLLATGFSALRPGGSVVETLIASASLPCASCGYPIVDTQLRWHPRIRVSGPLAELELGPVARNIAGARRAGDRLVGVA